MERIDNYLMKRLPEGVLLAFSGGVDSALLLALASRIPGKLTAVTFSSPLQGTTEAVEAAAFAAACGVDFQIEYVDVFSLRPELKHNPRERCYICKHALFSALKQLAAKKHLRHVMDGTNADDLQIFRPGRAALAELGILSPLAELGISKAEVRKFAAELGIPAATRPSAPCLATRFPYGAELLPEQMRQVEAGEELLKKMGFPVVRLRVHGRIVRIELPPEDFPKALACRDALLTGVEALGFHYCTLDLKGFRSGSMDE